ncbi:BrnT family toxin [Oligoflexia bacterium]|nr:BrnT family toxin [Oligoflexia bacterium]
MKVSVFDVDWDEGNTSKCQKHGITLEMIEEFLAGDFVAFPDIYHSTAEERIFAFGINPQNGRHMAVMFTLREYDQKLHVRPISARYMHSKEVNKYEKEIAKI